MRNEKTIKFNQAKIWLIQCHMTAWNFDVCCFAISVRLLNGFSGWFLKSFPIWKYFEFPVISLSAMSSTFFKHPKVKLGDYYFFNESIVSAIFLWNTMGAFPIIFFLTWSFTNPVRCLTIRYVPSVASVLSSVLSLRLTKNHSDKIISDFYTFASF